MHDVAKYLALYNGDGTRLKLWGASDYSTVNGYTRSWTVSYSFGTLGDSIIAFKCSANGAAFDEGSSLLLMVSPAPTPTPTPSPSSGGDSGSGGGSPTSRPSITVKCVKCHGSGTITCTNCNGSGKENYGYGSGRTSTTCYKCHGSGSITCTRCHGTGVE